MKNISTDINYPSVLFPKNFDKSIYDDMIENGEVCLTEKVCEEDKRRGGSGVALVNCPCPKCSPRF